MAADVGEEELQAVAGAARAGARLQVQHLGSASRPRPWLRRPRPPSTSRTSSPMRSSSRVSSSTLDVGQLVLERERLELGRLEEAPLLGTSRRARGRARSPAVRATGSASRSLYVLSMLHRGTTKLSHSRRIDPAFARAYRRTVRRTAPTRANVRPPRVIPRPARLERPHSPRTLRRGGPAKVCTSSERSSLLTADVLCASPAPWRGAPRAARRPARGVIVSVVSPLAQARVRLAVGDVRPEAAVLDDDRLAARRDRRRARGAAARRRRGRGAASAAARSASASSSVTVNSCSSRLERAASPCPS